MRRADRQVRETVKRYGGCLDVLTTRQERVLRLRAGVGAAEPAPRGLVAQRLDLSVAQVHRAERRGLRALQRAGRRGCPAMAPSVVEEQAYAVGGALGTVLAGGTLPGGTLRGSQEASSPGDADAEQAGGGGAGGNEGDKGDGDTSGTGHSGGVEGIAATSTPPDPDESSVTVLLLAVLAVLACAVGFGLEARRLWGSGAGELE